MDKRKFRLKISSKHLSNKGLNVVPTTYLPTFLNVQTTHLLNVHTTNLLNGQCDVGRCSDRPEEVKARDGQVDADHEGDAGRASGQGQTHQRAARVSFLLKTF